jgi:hypothetical protein
MSAGKALRACAASIISEGRQTPGANKGRAMAKIILLLLLGALGYVAFRRWIAPATPPSIGPRGDDKIIDAEWTDVDDGGNDPR